MSRAAGSLKSMQKNVEKKIISFRRPMKSYIPAGMASAAPPLGSKLGDRKINIAHFCKDFNEKTKDFKEGIPIPVEVKLNEDKSYELLMKKPPASYFLKQAAGIERGAMKAEIAGKITVKHIYELAKIKSDDPKLQLCSLEQICKQLIFTAHTCGIQVVHSLDPDEYGKFLEERKIIVAEQKQQLEEERQSKMMRQT